MTIFNVISLAGGLALFLYGMSIMGTGLEKYAGGRMESILQKLTSSTWRAVALGAVITALIQSSSGTTVIVVSTRASCSFPRPSASSWAPTSAPR